MDDETYLSGIRKGTPAVLEHLIRVHQPEVVRYIHARGGTTEEAEDIFGTALEILYVRARDENLELRESVGAYLFSICKYQWIKLFNQKKRLAEVTEGVERAHTDEASGPDVLLEQQLLHTYVRAAFKELSKDCRQIIRMRWNGETYAAIRDLMGHGSEAYTRKRKHICLQRLIKFLREDPRIREIYDEL